MSPARQLASAGFFVFLLAGTAVEVFTRMRHEDFHPTEQREGVVYPAECNEDVYPTECNEAVVAEAD